MSIYKASIDRPVTTILIFVAVIILGGFAYSRLPIDQFPEMDPPYVMVMTTYAGSNASEIETNVTKDYHGIRMGSEPRRGHERHTFLP